MTQFFKVLICIIMLLVQSKSIASDVYFLDMINIKKREFSSDFHVLQELMTTKVNENEELLKLKTLLKRPWTLFQRSSARDNIAKAKEMIDVANAIKGKIYDQDGNLKDDDALLREDFTFVKVKHLQLHSSLSHFLMSCLNPFFLRGCFMKEAMEKAIEKAIEKEAVYAQGLLNIYETNLPLNIRSGVSCFLGIPSPKDGEAIIAPIKLGISSPENGEAIIAPIKKSKKSMVDRFSKVSFVNKKDAFGSNDARPWCLLPNLEAICCTLKCRKRDLNLFAKLSKIA